MKRAERRSRLEQNNKRVQQLRASYPTTACPIPTYLGSNLYAFLAPALKECLMKSPFASKTRVVPGEADDWCALHANNEPRPIIFTSDTDLVLYNYPPETLIVFLQDADLSAGIKAYSPVEIRTKLQLKSLLPFAFAIRTIPSDTMGDLLHRAQNVDLEAEDYVNFSRRYTIDALAPTLPSGKQDLSSRLQDLDVRISEFVQQALDSYSVSHVYLPLLVEDPSQASAWTIGQAIRNLAYSLLAPRNSVVNEYKRKAQGIAIHEITLYSTSHIQTRAVELHNQVMTLMAWASSKAVGSGLIWPLFALSFVLADMNTPPLPSLALRVLNGDFDNTWTFVHLTARLQAALYSIRILAQVIRVWLVTHEKNESGLYGCLFDFQDYMKDLPSIADTFTILGQKPDVLAQHNQLRELIEEIYTSAGVEIPDEPTSTKKKKKQARDAERKKKKVEQRRKPAPEAANAFAILDN